MTGRRGRYTAGTVRTIAALCLLCLLVSTMSGCGGFRKEYLVVTEHVDSVGSEVVPDFSDISSYAQLRAALSIMVRQRQETAMLRFVNYTGDLSEDLSTASWSIRAESALGAWCVESVSYQLHRLVSFSEADITIRYKRTEQEMEQVHMLTGTVGLRSMIRQALAQSQPRLILSMRSRTMDADEALAVVQQAWLDDPLCSPAPPRVSAQVYYGQDFERLVDYTFTYEQSAQWLEQLRRSLTQTVGAMVDSLPAGDARTRLQQACGQLSGRCTYLPEATGFGETAYGALIIGQANSLGYAQACKLLCMQLEIPCQIVSGRYDRGEHYWNIVEIDGVRCHVDVSMAAQLGLSAVFLRSDSGMWGRYSWDIDAYEPCLGGS